MNNRLGEHYNRYQQFDIQESNNGNFSQNDFGKVFNQVRLQESEIVCDRVTHYLAVSSNQRDITNYPLSNSYTIQLPREYKNIVSMQLIESIIPNQNNITNQPYIVLNIKELQGKSPLESNDPILANAFALVQLTNNTGNFLQIDRKVHEIIILHTLQPINLAKMTISLTDHSGIPIDFGSDTGGVFNPLYQNTLVFKIVVLEKNRKELGQKPVF